MLFTTAEICRYLCMDVQNEIYRNKLQSNLVNVSELLGLQLWSAISVYIDISVNMDIPGHIAIFVHSTWTFQFI